MIFMLYILSAAEDRRERERELVSAEMLPTRATSLSFWEKFYELQYKMVVSGGAAPHGHMFASEPADWPLLARSVAYWLSHKSNVCIIYVQNIITYIHIFKNHKILDNS